MHIGTCVNLVRFLSHYFRFLKTLMLYSLLSLMGSRVLIGVGNKGGVGNGVGYLKASYRPNPDKQRSDTPGKLIYADLCGKMQTPSLGQLCIFYLLKMIVLLIGLYTFSSTRMKLYHVLRRLSTSSKETQDTRFYLYISIKEQNSATTYLTLYWTNM